MATPSDADRRRKPSGKPFLGREDSVLDRGLDDLIEDEELPDTDGSGFDDGEGATLDTGEEDDLEDERDRGFAGRARDTSTSVELPIGELPFVDDDRGASVGDLRGLAVDDDRDDDVGHFESAMLGGLEPDMIIDEPGLEEGPRSSADDGGIEGTSEDIAGEVDEANLPELDADDGGAFELDDLMREMRAEGLGMETSDAAWVTHESLGVVASFGSVAVDHGHLVAGGRVLAVIEPGSDAPRRHSLPHAATSVLAAPGGAIVGSAHGVHWVAIDQTLSLLESECTVSALGSFGGRNWVLAGTELWQLATPPKAASLVRKGVRAMAAIPEALVVLTEDALLARFRGDDGAWGETALDREAHALIERGPPRIALGAEGRVYALAVDGDVFLGREGGTGKQVVDLDGVASIAFGSGPEPLLYVASISSASLHVASVDAKGRNRLEAHIDLPAPVSGSPVDPSELAVAWDETRETLFVASSVGLFALGPRRTH